MSALSFGHHVIPTVSDILTSPLQMVKDVRVTHSPCHVLKKILRFVNKPQGYLKGHPLEMFNKNLPYFQTAQTIFHIITRQKPTLLQKQNDGCSELIYLHLKLTTNLLLVNKLPT